ncbi:hypothetical protein SNEBB_005878 [Seison nebaliae]|nr:hypothetical protein SNEBB_005878 [Seison nebaliae]
MSTSSNNGDITDDEIYRELQMKLRDKCAILDQLRLQQKLYQRLVLDQCHENKQIFYEAFAEIVTKIRIVFDNKRFHHLKKEYIPELVLKGTRTRRTIDYLFEEQSEEEDEEQTKNLIIRYGRKARSLLPLMSTFQSVRTPEKMTTITDMRMKKSEKNGENLRNILGDNLGMKVEQSLNKRSKCKRQNQKRRQQRKLKREKEREDQIIESEDEVLEQRTSNVVDVKDLNSTEAITKVINSAPISEKTRKKFLRK